MECVTAYAMKIKQDPFIVHVLIISKLNKSTIHFVHVTISLFDTCRCISINVV